MAVGCRDKTAGGSATYRPSRAKKGKSAEMAVHWTQEQP
jgi:hypothetical protein